MRKVNRARAIYLARKDEAGFSTKLAADIARLSSDAMNQDDQMTLESFTVNGQSFSGSSTNQWDLLDILLMVQKMMTDGVTYKTRFTRPSFY